MNIVISYTYIQSILNFAMNSKSEKKDVVQKENTNPSAVLCYIPPNMKVLLCQTVLLKHYLQL